MTKEKIKNIVVSNRIPFGICLSLLMINIIFYVGFIGYQERKINTLQASYSEMRKYKYGTHDSENDRFIRAREELIVFNSKLSPVSDLVITASELKNKFQISGITVSKMTFKPEKLEEKTLWKYTTSFTLSGQYEKLKRILADIHNSAQLYCIDRLAFYNDSDENEKVDLSLSITTYYNYNGKS